MQGGAFKQVSIGSALPQKKRGVESCKEWAHVVSRCSPPLLEKPIKKTVNFYTWFLIKPPAERIHNRNAYLCIYRIQYRVDKNHPNPTFKWKGLFPYFKINFLCRKQNLKYADLRRSILKFWAKSLLVKLAHRSWKSLKCKQPQHTLLIEK